MIEREPDAESQLDVGCLCSPALPKAVGEMVLYDFKLSERRGSTHWSISLALKRTKRLRCFQADDNIKWDYSTYPILLIDGYWYMPGREACVGASPQKW